MRYIDQINETLRSLIKEKPETVIFGQNVSAGSRISGLTKHIPEDTGCVSLNTPNCENSLVGMGFGMMLGGVSSIYFMKQLDFLLLGIDQMVNTYNLVRLKEPTASFTIVPVVTDIGYQGAQSSLNTLDDFCSISRTPGYVITNQHDAQSILSRHLLAPGFRTIAVSQRLFGGDVISYPDGVIAEGVDGDWFQYESGNDATIVCFNFSLPQGRELLQKMEAVGMNASIFTINNVAADSPSAILEAAEQSGKLIILNDSKSLNKSSARFIAAAAERRHAIVISNYERMCDKTWYEPNEERLILDHTAIIDQINWTPYATRKI